jgi:hypothetical protein
MFRISASDVLLFKQAITILKTEVVSIRASVKTKSALFCLHNRNSGLLLLHKVKAHVERDQEFGINSDRLVALLSKDNLELDYNGSSVSYKSGRSRGNVETHNPFFEPWPDVKQSGVPVQEVLDEFTFLNLKSKNAEIYIFGGLWEGQPVVAAGDREHAVFMPLQKSSTFTLPITALYGAQRIFKENVRAVVDNGTVFFQARTETYSSILRFGQLGDLDVLSLDTFGKFKALGNLWSTQIDIQAIKNILADYEAIKDSERTGLLLVTTDGKTITLTAKTRHGEVTVTEPAKGDTLADPVTLNTELIKDITKLEGSVTIGVKDNGRVFFMGNDKATYFSALGA